MGRVDLPHSEDVMGTDSNPYAAILSTAALRYEHLVSNTDFENKNRSEFDHCNAYVSNFPLNHAFRRLN